MPSANYDIRYVAIYLRKSRGEEEDLQKHEIVLTEMCKNNNWKFIKYKEIGTSDSIELRQEMTKLLVDVESRIYDAVLVNDYDRLSRGDMGEQDKIKKVFRKANTLIITPNKIYDLDNESDDMYTDFAGLIARQEYKQIKKRLQQGKKIGARMGNWTNGIPPFGYSYQRYKDKFNEKGLVVNDEEVDIFRYIVKKSLEGVSPHKIAWELNTQGTKTRKGNNWSNVAIYRILENETYLGKIISNKQKGDGHKIKKDAADEYKRLPKNEWTIVENCHEALIEQEDFDRIQSLIDKRRLLPLSARSSKAEFTGILRCGICGRTLSTQKRDDNSTIKPCNHRNEFGVRCINRGGSFNDVRDQLNKAVLQYRDSILANIGKSHDGEIKEIQGRIKAKNKDLRKFSEAFEKVQDSYELGDYSRDEFLTRKSKWEEKINNAKLEISRYERQLKIQEQITNRDKLEILNSYLENIDNISEVSDRNKFYKTFLESIIWTRIDDQEPTLTINFQ